MNSGRQVKEGRLSLDGRKLWMSFKIIWILSCRWQRTFEQESDIIKVIRFSKINLVAVRKADWLEKEQLSFYNNLKCEWYASGLWWQLQLKWKLRHEKHFNRQTMYIFFLILKSFHRLTLIPNCQVKCCWFR